MSEGKCLLREGVGADKFDSRANFDANSLTHPHISLTQIVLDADKDVLLQFYAPWCGHCKKFVPVYQKLALELADEDIVFAKFDATANEVDPLFEVYSVPTISLCPRMPRNPPFSMRHSTDGLKHFGRDGEKKMAEPTLAESESLGQENAYDDEL
uniref:protein disulfide-isomerase n=1 Tax=Ditylenchus dipsaci TaxID=166011 RepID=A0A915D292_9BILA